MPDDSQFIATPSSLDQAAGGSTAVADTPNQTMTSVDNQAFTPNLMPQTASQDDEHKTLREERLEYWKGKAASPEYLRSKKFDKDLAAEAGATLDSNGKITSVTAEILANLEEKMYVYIEQARRNLEESRRFDNSETFSPTEVIERLQEMVSSDPDSDLHKKLVAAIRDKTATMGMLHDMLVESETNAAYDCLEKAHEVAGFLNDIASGHASRSLLEEHAQGNPVVMPA
jgi:hypothetical protein